MCEFLIADGKNNYKEVLKTSIDMMNGYKWNYFLFLLSYLPWLLLIIVTLGFAIIWVIPYILLGQIIYYQELSKKYKKKNNQV